ncbi:exodeoxyribonuclease VII small subunit [Alkalibacillus haloalkaliphilus]|uniref:Exodeoxyribonuclease 7 small subunit n=1 Tax=Alkalibacillus haloalkaliphilus TaxID=94136 RepID=A0A511W2U7_9BACI|nr:exodeoxyribonuclease VII small subunit [Alkalibacillus haloalkaliphilus]MDV2580945.1 exodeoxyribonuclease VII small subunit [Alkalibacillus haloalkaliphilus]GEN45277.1 exodeoxyribonuclease 7 small subunit [Alkalibacillus haloalkaliphilus]
MENNNLTFEQAMEKLEKIVEQLEQGDVPLEQAIQYYKEGMQLSKVCHEKLKNVENEMTEILNENGESEPYTVEEES